MILLTDNDILIKLSQCDLVDEALTIFGCSLPECYILDTARYSLFLNNADKCIARRVGNSQAYDRLCELVEGCSELGAAEENLDFLEELSQMENLDPGEQALLLHAHQLHNSGEPFWLTTGDRKALLGVHNSGSEVAKRILRQRVDCTESLILKMLGIYGFDVINHKICGAIPVTDRFDSVLRMAFGNGRDLQHAQACLQSYLDQLTEYIRP